MKISLIAVIWLFLVGAALAHHHHDRYRNRERMEDIVIRINRRIYNYNIIGQSAVQPAMKKFTIVAGTFDYGTARAQCATIGGRLATIKSVNDRNAADRVLAIAGRLGDTFWIGLSVEAGQWAWSDALGVAANPAPIFFPGGTIPAPVANHASTYRSPLFTDQPNLAGPFSALCELP